MQRAACRAWRLSCNCFDWHASTVCRVLHVLLLEHIGTIHVFVIVIVFPIVDVAVYFLKHRRIGFLPQNRGAKANDLLPSDFHCRTRPHGIQGVPLFQVLRRAVLFGGLFLDKIIPVDALVQQGIRVGGGVGGASRVRFGAVLGTRLRSGRALGRWFLGNGIVHPVQVPVEIPLQYLAHRVCLRLPLAKDQAVDQHDESFFDR
mmetsp:Transcript_10003/g.21514  ORF Transcript_10003/g.21514 Transcript_10003/m.21514 type:complete len:203 (-) Transcript_10003:652-1260(-)